MLPECNYIVVVYYYRKIKPLICNKLKKQSPKNAKTK